MTEVKQFWWKMPNGQMKLVDVSEFHRVMAALPDRSNGVAPPAPNAARPGLGDAIASATKKVGIKPCAGCKRRQAWLNRWTPAWLSRLLGRLGGAGAPPARCGGCARRKAEEAARTASRPAAAPTAAP